MPAVQNTILLSWIVIGLLDIKKNIALVLADFLKIGKIRTPSHFGQFLDSFVLKFWSSDWTKFWKSQKLTSLVPEQTDGCL